MPSSPSPSTSTSTPANYLFDFIYIYIYIIIPIHIHIQIFTFSLSYVLLVVQSLLILSSPLQTQVIAHYHQLYVFCNRNYCIDDLLLLLLLLFTVVRYSIIFLVLLSIVYVYIELMTAFFCSSDLSFLASFAIHLCIY